MYAADRFDDVLVSFRVDPATGKLTKLGIEQVRRQDAAAYRARSDRALDAGGESGLRQDRRGEAGCKDRVAGGDGEENFLIVKPQCLVFV